jgi:hypothetical protein
LWFPEFSLFRLALGTVNVEMLNVLDQRFGHLLDWQDIIRQPSGDGALRHRGIFGRFRVLNHGHSISGLDCFQPE